MQVDFFSRVILLILAIDGLRNIIAHVGWVPLNWGKFSNFIYGKKDKLLIQQVLIDLGYTEAKAISIIAGMSKNAQRRLISFSPTHYYRSLLVIIKKCMLKTEPLRYGSTHTEYYIHTMMASQDYQIIKAMSDLLIYLIRKDYPEKLDFIIVPKSGNPLLGNFVAKSIGVPCLVYKDKREPSRANDPLTAVGGSNPELDLEINFEGAYYLNRDKKLKGIVLDCNTSGGKQLLEAATEFNEAISNADKNIKIKNVEDIYTLFRVDDAHSDIDAKFAHSGFKLHRFFDLNEKLKVDIYNIVLKDVDLDAKCPCVDNIISKMSSMNLLKLSELQNSDINEDTLSGQASIAYSSIAEQKDKGDEARE